MSAPADRPDHERRDDHGRARNPLELTRDADGRVAERLRPLVEQLLSLDDDESMWVLRHWIVGRWPAGTLISSTGVPMPPESHR